METPKWNTGDGIRSIRDVGKMFLEWLDRKDTELANRINSQEDEDEPERRREVTGS